MPSTRMQLLRLMSRARVICYDGQELVSSLIPHFDLEDGQGIVSSFLAPPPPLLPDVCSMEEQQEVGGAWKFPTSSYNYGWCP